MTITSLGTGASHGVPMMGCARAYSIQGFPLASVEEEIGVPEDASAPEIHGKENRNWSIT